MSACESSSFRAVLVEMLEIDARDLILEFCDLRADVRYAAMQSHVDIAESHSEFF